MKLKRIHINKDQKYLVADYCTDISKALLLGGGGDIFFPISHLHFWQDYYLILLSFYLLIFAIFCKKGAYDTC